MTSDLLPKAAPKVIRRMQEIAQVKNLQLTETECESLVIGFLRDVGLFDADGELAGSNAEFAAKMDREIDACLDYAATERAVRVTAERWQMPIEDIDLGFLYLLQQEGLRRLRQMRSEGSFYRWPDIRGGMEQAFEEFDLAGHPFAGAFAGRVSRA